MKRLLLATMFMLALSAGVARADCHDEDCIAVATPDGGTTLTLMTGAMIGLGILRRKFRG